MSAAASRSTAPHVLLSADTAGGAWIFALELMAGCAEAGVRFTLALAGAPPDEADRRRLSRLPHVTIRHLPGRLEWMPEPWADVDRTGAWLRRIAEEVRPDIVHLNSYACAADGFDQPTVVTAHSCVCSWWRAVHGVAAPTGWDEYRARVARGLAAADVVVAPSHAMLQALVREHGPVRDGTVIANGLAAAPARSPHKEPIVFCAGRLWDEGKNLAVLDRTAPAIAWPIVAAGPLEPPGSDTPRPVRHLRALGRLDRSEIRRWMRRAAIYVHPARYEPFGLSVLEAAQSGCALVLGRIPSLIELWHDAACFVDPDDEDALAAALTELIVDHQARRRLAATAVERARRYGATPFARAYLDLYVRMGASHEADRTALTRAAGAAPLAR